MIKGICTNKVYLSKLLSVDFRFKKTCDELIKILEKNEVKYGFLESTYDIWCRDYMPIQVNKDKFVQFRYEPSYLKNHPEIQSNPIKVCEDNNLKPRFSSINLDGGNVVNWYDRVIITDRVFTENPEFSNNNKLINEIENLLETEVILIPQIKSDFTGHADGLVRFVDRNTLIGNSRNDEFKYWHNRINKVLKHFGIDYIDLPFIKHKEKKFLDHAIGCYVNYLEVEDLILLPIFEVVNNKDIEVYDKFKQIFPERKIETINYNDIGIFGGLLNCTTWTIEE
jgi:agmatine deiminase